MLEMIKRFVEMRWLRDETLSKKNRDEMKEMRWKEMRWNEMLISTQKRRWDEMRWDLKRWDEGFFWPVKKKEMKRDEMKRWEEMGFGHPWYILGINHWLYVFRTCT